MSKYLRLSSLFIAFIAILVAGSTALASIDLATTFTYQGFLSSNGTPVTGPCDFEFSLFDAANAGTQLGTTQSVGAVAVSGGVFTVALNGSGQFGATAFDGNDRYLDIRVRCPAGGAGTFTQLLPRSPITSAPSALFAANAATAASATNATNAANAVTATIANGLNGLIVQQNATSPNLIGGFSGNTVAASKVGATIGGGGTTGFINQVNGNYGVVSGGADNTAGGDGAFVGGGQLNAANSLYSAVAGGNQNTANNQHSFVGGGLQNTAGGEWSTVPGGFQNSAAGNYSFAAGKNAQAANHGSFVWNDSTGTSVNPLASTDVNQFVVRASGGATFLSTATGVTDVGVTLAPGTGSWGLASDRNLKANLETVDPLTVLNDVVSLPISTWNYIAQGDSIRHIGPMAQDFHAAFGLGEDDRHISAVDSDGVALAAIQGLYQVVQDKDAQIAALQTENAELKTRLDDLDQRLAALEALAVPSQAGLSVPVMLAGIVFAGGMGLAGRRLIRKDVSQ